MEKLLNELKEIVNNNKLFNFCYEIKFNSEDECWGIDIDSEFENYIYSEYGRDLKELIEDGIKAIKKYINEFEWEE